MSATEADVEAIIAAKPDGCQICGHAVKQLALDHDHVTGCIRGWLCPRCNMALGTFEKHREAILRWTTA